MYCRIPTDKYIDFADKYDKKNGIKDFGLINTKEGQLYSSFFAFQYEELSIGLFRSLYERYIQYMHNKKSITAVLSILPEHKIIGLASKYSMKDYKRVRMNVINPNGLWCQTINATGPFIIVNDDKPRACIHQLLIPRKFYADLGVWLDEAPEEEQLIPELMDWYNRNSHRYSLFVTNIGDAQSVPFLHFHLIAGVIK